MLYKLLRQYLDKNFFEEEMKNEFFVEKMLLVLDQYGVVLVLVLGDTGSV